MGKAGSATSAAEKKAKRLEREVARLNATVAKITQKFLDADSVRRWSVETLDIRTKERDSARSFLNLERADRNTIINRALLDGRKAYEALNNELITLKNRLAAISGGR